MATTDDYIKYDIRFFEEFSRYLNYTDEELKHLQKAIFDGLLQRERLVELAVSRVSGIKLDSTHGMDMADSSDVKTVVSVGRKNNKNTGQWVNSFKVPRVYTKVGDLRIVAYNKILDQFHYFFVPYSAYRNIKVLEIVLETHTNHGSEFEFTGLPNRNKKWWNYEVDSFEDLCFAQSKPNILEQKFQELFPI